MTVRTLLLLALCALPAGASAQRARLSVLTDSASVGERIRVAVVVTHAPGRSVVFPAVPAGSAETGPLLSFGDAEAFSVRRLPPRADGTVRVDSAVYTVAVFAIDEARIGPVRVKVATGRDTVRVSTGVARVPVRSEIDRDPSATPSSLGPPDPFPSLIPVWLALGVVLSLVIAAAGWAFRRWRARPGAEALAVAPFPEAVRSFDALAPQTAADQTLGAREALRVFVARRLGVPALETTTQELDAMLAADARVPEQARTEARRALQLADLVAFAGVTPSPEAAHEAVQAARASVEEIEQTARIREAEARRAEETRRKAADGGQTVGDGGPKPPHPDRSTEAPAPEARIPDSSSPDSASS